MADEEATKSKTRIKIERDAHPALLSFKGGATPRQVEQKIFDLFGITYKDKYHLAGVQDMCEILREHPEVRQRYDGKFEIIANELNKDLVGLVARQKDKKESSRSRSSVGFHHQIGFRGGVYPRFSPKRSYVKRPMTSLSKWKPEQPYTLNAFRSFSPVCYPCPSTSSKFSNAYNTNHSHNPFTFAEILNASVSLPIQRPLVRSSITGKSKNQADRTSTVSMPQSLKPAQYPDNMPSIKQFSDNLKCLMLKLHPKFILLSEMTDRYKEEYNVTVEPLQLFSKSWIMLIKTTFKEWLQVINESVSLRDEWFKKYGSISIHSIHPTDVPTQVRAPNKDRSTHFFTELKLTSNENIECSVQESLLNSPVELMMQHMKRLTIGTRQELSTPNAENPHKAMNPIIKFLIEERPNTDDLKNTSPFCSFKNMRIRNSIVNGYDYDSSELIKIRTMMKSEGLNNNITAVLKAFRLLKRRCKHGQYPRLSMSYGIFEQMANDRSINASRKIFKHASGDFHDSDSSNSNQSSLSPPDTKPTRMNLDNNWQPIMRTGKSSLAVPQEKTMITHYSLDSDQKSMYMGVSSATSVSIEKIVSFASEIDTNDKKVAPSFSIEKNQDKDVSVLGRELLLPPMSKGKCSKIITRSLPKSNSQTAFSVDSSLNIGILGQAIHARISDDEF